MRRIFWYNPENDIALGRGVANFTPPAAAVELARYGAPLMSALAREGDVVVVEAMNSCEYSAKLRRWAESHHLCKGVEFVSDGYGRDWSGFTLCPWGWSTYAAHRLRGLGFHVGMSDDSLSLFRMLSHRRSSVYINKLLRERVDFGQYNHPLPVAAVEARSIEEVVRAVKVFSGEAFLKTPWSSSGRGVWHMSVATIRGNTRRIESCLQQQGSVMVEPAYDKVLDFAMLFHCNESHPFPIGYSVFATGGATNYTGNMLADDSRLEHVIASGLPSGFLQILQSGLTDILSELLNAYASKGLSYSGYLGVDMMKVNVEGKPAVVPCVELNARTTMGVVAHQLYAKLIESGLAESPLALKMWSKHCPALTPPPLLMSLIPENPFFEIAVVKK